MAGKKKPPEMKVLNENWNPNNSAHKALKLAAIFWGEFARGARYAIDPTAVPKQYMYCNIDPKCFHEAVSKGLANLKSNMPALLNPNDKTAFIQAQVCSYAAGEKAVEFAMRHTLSGQVPEILPQDYIDAFDYIQVHPPGSGAPFALKRKAALARKQSGGNPPSLQGIGMGLIC